VADRADCVEVGNVVEPVNSNGRYDDVAGLPLADGLAEAAEISASN
jgi:hypothetical protein